MPLRVYVAGGGCCGVNFGMALDNNFRDVDTTFEANGVKVVVDEVSIDYLRGATIDFVNDPQHGAGFAVNSPNAKGQGTNMAKADALAEAEATPAGAVVVPAPAITNLIFVD